MVHSKDGLASVTNYAGIRGASSTLISVLWISGGMVSYTLMSLAAHYFLHQPEATTALRQQVPAVFYDRSTYVFLTAFCIDALNLVFERTSNKGHYVLLPAMIKGIASCTNLLVTNGMATLMVGPTGRIIVVQRYICWLHTTPTILLLLKLISPSTTTSQFCWAIAADLCMILAGCASSVFSGYPAVVLGIISHLALLPTLPYLCRTLSEMNTLLRHDHAAGGKTVVYYPLLPPLLQPMALTLWLSFGMVWLGGALNILNMASEELGFLILDFGAKVVLSSSLLLSSFKRIEIRREEAMRVIEAGGRLATITELRDAVDQKERFMSTVGHELRTPLNGIIGISDGLLAGSCGPLPKELHRNVLLVRTSGARLLSLINDVMDAAALRANSLAVRPQSLALRDLVEDVVDLTRMLVNQGVELINRVPTNLRVHADGDRLVQVLNNLLGNAAKFTEKGRIAVSAKCTKDKTMAQITVADTGMGIPESTISAIFEPFGQADNSAKRSHGGFGLGLNITKELIKAHGGLLTVDSVEGRGSSFTFTLPLAPDSDDLHSSGSLVSSANVNVPATPAPAKALGQGVDDYEMPYSRWQLSALANTNPFKNSSGGMSPRDADPAMGRQMEEFQVEELLTSLEVETIPMESEDKSLEDALSIVRDEMARVRLELASNKTTADGVEDLAVKKTL